MVQPSEPNTKKRQTERSKTEHFFARLFKPNVRFSDIYCIILKYKTTQPSQSKFQSVGIITASGNRTQPSCSKSRLVKSSNTDCTIYNRHFKILRCKTNCSKTDDGRSRPLDRRGTPIAAKLLPCDVIITQVFTKDKKAPNFSLICVKKYEQKCLKSELQCSVLRNTNKCPYFRPFIQLFGNIMKRQPSS